MDHDMNVQNRVQILLGFLQLVHLGEQSHLILGLDHHQPSPQTPVVSYVSFEKLSKDACLPVMIPSALLLEYSNISGLEYSRTKSCIHI